MELSKRLLAVASLVTTGSIVADIGTDHAYIPLYLIQEKKAPGAIAMDVNEGPLLRAEEHVRDAGLTEQIRLKNAFYSRSLRSNGSDRSSWRRDLCSYRKIWCWTTESII